MLGFSLCFLIALHFMMHCMALLKKMHEVPLIRTQRKHVTFSPNHHVRYSALSVRKKIPNLFSTPFLLGTFQIVCPFKNER